MRFELLPLLEAIAAMKPRPALVTSVRDILQERTKPGRDAETVEILNRHFDLVMVHGDPVFAKLADTFPLASSIDRRNRLHRHGGGGRRAAFARALRCRHLGRRRRGRHDCWSAHRWLPRETSRPARDGAW